RHELAVGAPEVRDDVGDDREARGWITVAHRGLATGLGRDRVEVDLAEQGVDDPPLRADRRVDRLDRPSRRPRDLGDRRARGARRGEQVERGVEDALAGGLGLLLAERRPVWTFVHLDVLTHFITVAFR